MVYNRSRNSQIEFSTNMIIDLHIHSKTCSDGNLSVEEIIAEAKTRNIELMSITDHDSIGCQRKAKELARINDITYINGLELNINFLHSKLKNSKPISLDLLGYQFNIQNKELNKKLKEISEYRKKRAEKILENLNTEFEREGIEILTKKDLVAIQNSVDGVLGRPHIADYLIKKSIVKNRQEAFTKYLEKCNVQKYPLSLEEASSILRDAGGIVILAHPNDPYGTSLVKLTKSLSEQTNIIKELMLKFIDGIECWHFRNDAKTTDHYYAFSLKHKLIMTGGSDCHQKPIRMGSVKVPSFVAQQFNIK